MIDLQREIFKPAFKTGFYGPQYNGVPLRIWTRGGSGTEQRQIEAGAHEINNRRRELPSIRRHYRNESAGNTGSCSNVL
jgi:hypothetical protein